MRVCHLSVSRCFFYRLQSKIFDSAARAMLSISKAGKRKFPAEEFNSDNTKINLITQTKLSDDTRSSESRFVFESEFVVHLFFLINLSFVKNLISKNGLSVVRLPVVGSLVIFVFVCWCSRVPAHYAMSVTANG